MPDAWEQANGLNPNAADDSSDADGDGSTNLEAYLHELTTTPTPRGKYAQATYNDTAYVSLQAAVEALPANGGEILVPPMFAGGLRESLMRTAWAT